MKKVIMLIVILIVLFIPVSAQADMKFPTINDFNVPEYLKLYVRHVIRSNYTKTYDRDGIRYIVLAESYPNGNIRLYNQVPGMDVNMDDVVLHEIGHLVYWNLYGNFGCNSEELANKFVVKAKETNTLKELLISMGYWQEYFDELFGILWC